MFQVIAPINAAKTISSPLPPVGVSMIPSPTVLATLVEISAPTMFITAANANAVRGVRALVDTDVAIALAASWKPLV